MNCDRSAPLHEPVESLPPQALARCDRILTRFERSDVDERQAVGGECEWLLPASLQSAEELPGVTILAERTSLHHEQSVRDR